MHFMRMAVWAAHATMSILKFERPRSNDVPRWPDRAQRFYNDHQIVQHLKRLARVRNVNFYSTFSSKWRSPQVIRLHLEFP